MQNNAGFLLKTFKQLIHSMNNSKVKAVLSKQFLTYFVKNKPHFMANRLEEEIKFLQPNNIKLTLLESGQFHPLYYAFTPFLIPNIDLKTHWRFDNFAQTYLEKTKEPKQADYVAGSFYYPQINAEGKSVITKATDQQIAQARSLFCLPIYARNEKEIALILTQYCNFLGFKDFGELQRQTPYGVVAYAANNHSRDVEELRTLRYLERSNYDTITPWEYGYHEVYQRYVLPKLFNPQGELSSPTNFYLTTLTGSYSNRLFDQLLGMIDEEVTKHGGKSSDYLAQCYGLHLIANPYNFTRGWAKASDWRNKILQAASSDIVWGLTDIATRVLPELDLLLCHFRKFGHHIIQLQQTKRQAIIIAPEIRTDYQGLSLSATTASILGHDLDAAIKAMQIQQPELHAEFIKYFRREISKAEFDRFRMQMNHRYCYDPQIGIPLRDITNDVSVSAFTLIRESLRDVNFWYSLYLLIHRPELVQHPRFAVLLILNIQRQVKASHFLQNRIQKLKNNDKAAAKRESKSFDVKTQLEDIEDEHHLILNDFNEVKSAYEPLDFGIVGDIDSTRRALFIVYLIKSLAIELKQDPNKKQEIQKLFESMEHASFNNSFAEGTFLHELLSLDGIIWKIYCSNILKPTTEAKINLQDKKNFSLVNDVFAQASYQLYSKIIGYNTPDYANKICSLLGLQDQLAELARPEHFAYLFGGIIPADFNFQKMKEMLWDSVLNGAKHFHDLSDINSDLYCAVLFEEYTYMTGLKTRVANQAYMEYLKSFADKNSAIAEFLAIDEQITQHLEKENVDPQWFRNLLSLLQQADSKLKEAMEINPQIFSFKKILIEMPNMQRAEEINIMLNSKEKESKDAKSNEYTFKRIFFDSLAKLAKEKINHQSASPQ